MTEAANRDASPKAEATARELVLGFDAGCSSCTDLAKVIEARVDGKLSVRNLRDPELQRWRERALGVAAPWAPTLFEVEGDEVRAWVGAKMGLALGRRLGPRNTWRVMQILGEIGATPRIEATVEESDFVEKLPSKAQEALVGISRGQFLKGVGGAAVAMSVLSGAGSLPSPAYAATRPEDVIRRTKLTGAKLKTVAQRAAATRDARNVVGPQLSTAAKVAAAKPVAIRHTLRNGNTLLAVAYGLANNRILLYHGYRNRPLRGANSQARLLHAQSRNGLRTIIVNGSEGGQLWRNPNRRATSTNGARALGECPPVGGGTTVPPPTGCTYNQCGGGSGYFTDSVCVSSTFECEGACGATLGGCANAHRAPSATGKVFAYLGCGGAAIVCLGQDQCCQEYSTIQRPCVVPCSSVY